jgi:hypothetical protein
LPKGLLPVTLQSSRFLNLALNVAAQSNYSPHN